MNYHDLLPLLRDRTRATPQQVARVRHRLDLQLVPARAELEHLPKPSAQAVARVSARLRQSHGSRPSAAKAAPLALGIGTLAFAALSTAAGVAWYGQQDAADPELQLFTLSQGAPAPALRGLDIVEHDGQGSLVRDGRTVTIEWEYGRLDVASAEGLSVVVLTPEGRVDLPSAGGRLQVERSALGTGVTVLDGSAALACGDDLPAAARVANGALPPGISPAGDAPDPQVNTNQTTALASGAAHTCLPRTASGWLNRLHALETSGLSPAELVAETDRALAAPGSGAEMGEIWTLRLNTQIAAGWNAAALESAEHALANTPDAGRAEGLHRTAARLALVLGDCARALPHLDALDALDEDERAHRDRCAAQARP